MATFNPQRRTAQKKPAGDVRYLRFRIRSGAVSFEAQEPVLGDQGASHSSGLLCIYPEGQHSRLPVSAHPSVSLRAGTCIT